VLLTVTTTHQPATDLGYLLYKHPDRVQSFDLPVGTAHVCYPRADPDECTAALLLDVDPIDLVRGRRPGPADFALGQYVNDRPYVASSLLSVAIGTVFRSALRGRCDSRPELARTPIPLRFELPAVPASGGADLVRRLFEPLGWQVDARPIALDPEFPEWGDSRYLALTLTGELRLADGLSHLYVLLPVLDDAKHYWVAEDEVDKLLRAGGSWLAGHSQRELITTRYLAHRRGWVRSALTRLAEADDATPEELDAVEPAGEPVEPLAVRRRATVMALLTEIGARRVVDLGCGPGALLVDLLAASEFTEILGVDVSTRTLERAARRLNLDRLPERARARITLRQSALTYTDPTLAGYDAAVLMEVIEHLDPIRLPALERAVFGSARPKAVLVTTPNAEYNTLFPDLSAGGFRHADHRFEWTRAEFRDWATGVAERFGYAVEFRPVGEADPDCGPPTQLALLRTRGSY
jgi:3' terminal RNA ribose 2'-O-methyltransferase Hen1